MRSLLTKNEVADLMGCTPRWVEINSAKFVTEVADKKSRNGRPARLYHLSSLPAEAQLRWARRQQEKVVEMVPAEASPAGQMALALTVPVGPNLSVEDREEAERRFSVIEPLVEKDKHRLLWAQAGGRKCKLIEILAQQHETKPRTIYHWLKAWKEGGLAALVTRDRSDKGRPRSFNNAALDFILAAALPRKGKQGYGLFSIREIYRAYEEERAWRASHAGHPLGEFEMRKYARYLDESGRLAESAQLPAASYETFRVWFNRIPEVVRVMAREGEEAFSNTQGILSFRDLRDLKPLEYVVMDHRRLDIFCLARADRGGWRLIRPWLTAALDMRTRLWLAWSIVEQPSSDSIAAVMKRSFLDYGIPEAVYWDNGKDFTCEWLEGTRGSRRVRAAGRVEELSPAMRGVLGTLGVRVHHAIVKRARSKIIEPNFLNVANFDRTLPWWCGHKPSARPERFEELVEQHEAWLRGERRETPFPTIEHVAGLYDEFLSSLNEREHSGEGMEKITPTGRGWMSPAECWERAIRGIQMRRATPEVLQFCFQKRRRLTIRNGEVAPSFGGRQFHYRLGHAAGLAALNGREVEFAYDPHDLGTGAVYYEGRFVGLVDNVELRRMGEESFVADERERRAMRREVKRFIEGVHRSVYIPEPEQRARRRMAVRPAAVMAEPAQAEQTAALPAACVAAAAAAKEQAFSFANADDGADLIRQANLAAYRDDDPDDEETEFHFFSQEG